MPRNIHVQPRIFTASWFTPLPRSIVRIGISRGAPRREPRGYRMLRCLAPGVWFNNVDEPEYIRLYLAQLADLNAADVLVRITAAAAGADAVALLCFERAGSGMWCHRSIVGSWLSTTTGVPVPEFGYESCVQEQHPLLPPSWRGQNNRT